MWEGFVFLICIHSVERLMWASHNFRMPTPPSLSPKAVAESTKTITVVLADDAILTRQSLAIAMPILFSSCLVVGQASDGDEALELCVRLKPMVLISDLRLPKRNGIVLITQLKSLLPALGVMIHTGCENGVMLGMACDAHPAGVVHSEDGVNGLRKGFEAAISGERYVSKAVMERITRQGGERCKLTPTELIVLMKVVGGESNKEIALRLGISERTVGAHRESINKKLGTHDQASMLKWAIQNGFVE